MKKLGWCMTGHHSSCPRQTISGLACGCGCHRDGRIEKQERRSYFFDTAEALLSSGEIHERRETVSLGLDGILYEVEMTQEHIAQLQASLAPFLEGARCTSGESV
ncbi:hypothetical protein [Streptomyces sp. NPDC002952]|uniref:Lsr2 dimerization domain-containing protein n=1 Tax=Streptomyces sp. NPDC002952 TaxID=3364673 RepID=UPI0036752F97